MLFIVLIVAHANNLTNIIDLFDYSLSIYEFLVVLIPFAYDIVNVLSVVGKGRVNLAIGCILEFYIVDFTID